MPQNLIGGHLACALYTPPKSKACLESVSCPASMPSAMAFLDRRLEPKRFQLYSLSREVVELSNEGWVYNIVDDI